LIKHFRLYRTSCTSKRTLDQPQTMASPAVEEPRWMSLYRKASPAKDVATAWLEDMEPEAKKEAEQDPAAARARLRRAIIDSPCAEVRADAANGWKYTGTILRAADEVVGIPPPVPRFAVGGPAPGTAAAIASLKGSADFRPKLVVEGGGQPGELGVWWSDFETAMNSRKLREDCGVTHRLNVAAEAVSILDKQAEEDPSLKTLHVPMEDTFNTDGDLSELWPKQLKEALDILRSLRDEGAVVNINCQMGKNRSGAAVLLWLCCECGWQLEDAVQHLRSINTLACGNPHLLAVVAQILDSKVDIPLNPAGDGGSWVCISPPGTPRAGVTRQFEQRAANLAAGKLSEAGLQAAFNKVEDLEDGEEVAGLGDLFGGSGQYGDVD